MANKRFGKVGGAGEITFAPDTIGDQLLAPTDAEYIAAGWSPVCYNAPEAIDGKVARFICWKFEDGKISRVYEYDDIVQAPRVFSKLYLITALKSRGLYEKFKSLISSKGLYDEWQAANELNESYPGFAAYRAAVITALDITEEDCEMILNEAVAR